MRGHTYELRVRVEAEETRLDLYEMPPISNSNSTVKGKRLVTVKENQTASVQGAIARALKNNKFLFSDVKRGRKLPFKLKEEDGVRLDLIFRSVNGVKRRTRIEDIMLGIESMSREEAYYWHAKVTKGDVRTRSNGLKALRILLGGE